MTGWFGSSPRGRGTRFEAARWPGMRRIIPAWAGNTLRITRHLSHRSDHPRVGGEHDAIALSVNGIIGSSPRGRGTRVPARIQRRQ